MKSVKNSVLIAVSCLMFCALMAPLSSLAQSPTFYSLQNSNSPPLPYDPFPSLPVTEIGTNIFLFDDSSVDYSPQMSSSMALSSSLLLPGDGDPAAGDSVTNAPTLFAYQFTTNDFWLEILSAGTNAFNYDTNSATLILHGTIPGDSYELLSAPALTNPVWTVEQTLFGAEGQNWTPTTVSMVGRPTLFFIARNMSQDSDGNGLPDWWQLQYFGQLGVDPYGDPDRDGWTNFEEYQNGTDPHAFNVPPPPRNVAARLDATGTNVVVTWASGGGPVDHYDIIGKSGNALGTVSSNTFIFTNYPDYQFVGDFFVQPSYVVRAYFSDSSHADSSAVAVSKSNLNAALALMRGPSGQPYLMVGSPPDNLSAIILIWGDQSAPSSLAIYATNLVHGIMPLPLSQMVGYLPAAALNYQLIATNGDFGESLPLVPYFAEETLYPYYYYNFVDARRQIKENLKFLLRSATITQPFGYTSNQGIDPSDDTYESDVNYTLSPDTYFARGVGSTNYEYSGFRVFDPDFNYSILQELRPVQENYLWRNFVFSTGDFTNGNFATGAGYDPAYLMRTLTDPNYQYSGSVTQSPLPLAFSTTNAVWLYYRRLGTDLGGAAEIGISPSGNHFFLNSNVRNCYGLALNSVAVDANQIFTPGSVISNSSGLYFINFELPSLSTEGYFFTSQTRYFKEGAPRPPLPGSPDFNVANPSPVLITSVGQPITVAGWAKQQILNNYPNIKYAYLEQYFTNAFKIDTNGVITTNQTGLLSPYGEFFPTEPGPTALVTMPDIDTDRRGTGVVQVIALDVDANHDGVMDFTFGGPDHVTDLRPFRFWVNDDNDSGDTGGDDIPDPNNKKSNALDGEINGVRDLVDFFPVYINIRGLLKVLPPGGFSTSITYRLSQADSALNFAYTDLKPDQIQLYLTDTNVSSALARADTMHIVDTGLNLDTSFLNKISNEGKGIILVEARRPTSQPLVLEVRSNNVTIAHTELPLSVSEVESMFRQKNLIREVDTNSLAGFPDRLADSDVPNELATNDKNLVFLHGYNVNPNQARGWFSEMYKRFYWSGSHAKFFGITYQGNDGQLAGQATPNLQTNIVHALETAPKLSAFLNSLPGTNILAAHSLGNVVILGALHDWANTNIDSFFMIDAAVSLEAMDGGAAVNTNMIHPEWTSYPTSVWASYWYQLFPSGDNRSQLTWRNRLSNLRNAKVYNFYSSGEEVLRMYPGTPPSAITAAGAEIADYVQKWTIARALIRTLWPEQSGLPVGDFVWAWQEKMKGRCVGNWFIGSNHNGWGFNLYYYHEEDDGGGGTVHVHMSAGDAAQLPVSQLQTNAFFDVSFYPSMFGSNGSQYAQTNLNRILSDAIPCLTLPVGANPVPRLQALGRNFNMNSEFQNGWPQERLNTSEGNNWHHSDVHEVAYTYTYQLFSQIVTSGNLQ